MALRTAAGSRLWIGGGAVPNGGIEVGRRVTRFVTTESRAITERTGITHTRRRREDGGLADAGFEIDGIFDTDILTRLSGGADFYLIPEPGNGAEAWRFAGRLTPGDTLEHPLGALVQVKGAGTLDAAPAEGVAMLHGQEHTVTGAGSTNYNTAGNGRYDRGAGAAQEADVLLAVALDATTINPDGATLDIELTHSASAGGAYANVSGAGFEVVIRGDTDPGLYTWAGSVSNLRRYLGLRAHRSASLQGAATFTAMVFVS